MFLIEFFVVFFCFFFVVVVFVLYMCLYVNTVRSDGTDFVIKVPQEVLLDSDSLVYSLYESPNLFQVVPPSDGSDISVEADTMVVGFNLVKDGGQKNVTCLPNPIIIALQGQAQNNSVC